MKHLSLVTVCFFIVIFSLSAQQREKVFYTYNFPSEMKEEVKTQYIKLFNKGSILYQVNCAKCHNKTEKRVEVMPEFTREHLAKYELRIQNPQHEEELNETRVNAEELGQIMIFLNYYKKANPAN